MRFWDVFILISVVQGVFVGMSLTFSRFFKSQANQYLGLAIFTLTILTFFGWLDADQVLLSMITSIMWEFLFPVFLFRYFIITLKSPTKDKKWLNYLYLPFIVSTVIRLVLDLSFTADLYSLPFDENSWGYAFYVNVEYNISFFYGVVLVVWCCVISFKKVYRTQTKAKWLQRLSIAVLFLYLLWSLADIIEYVYSLDVWLMLWTSISILFLCIVYFGVYQFELLEKRLVPTSKVSVKPTVSPQENKHFISLESLMKDKQLFKNSDLTREKVAEELQISEGYLTKIVKEAVNKNFSDYVNTYRVENCKALLQDPTNDKYSLQAIGLDSGFKSRSAFYNAFQKLVGDTPGEYKKQIRLS